jgi:NADPH2:quinone reductase
MGAVMKAIRVHEFGPPEVMKLEDVPDPLPDPGQVVVRVHAAGVNPVETYIRSGSYANKPTLPYTPGGDAAGVIAAVGEKVGRFSRGNRVYTAGTMSGAYAQLALCGADQVYPLPENVSFAQGAGLHVPYATAYRALFQRAQARAGQTVLVHGASGGVGIAAVQFAAAAGLTVIGTGGTERGRRLVREQGAAHVLDHRAPDYLDQLMTLTDGRGVDLILEMLANVNLGRDLTVLAKSGCIVVIGSRGEVQINPRLLMRSEGSILGLMAGTPEQYAQAHAAIGAGLRAGALRPIVGQELPLAEAPRAHHNIIESPAYGKIVLVP